ncbi:MAG: (2Fe-2S)-binding protein [Candidatus Neomarinimicrobiota bacterium]
MKNSLLTMNLTVNGYSRTILIHPHDTLLDTLRQQLFLTGTKKSCDQASCGSCTVWIDGVPVLSCITPTARCRGKNIETIEGISSGENLHPVQKNLVKKGGLQCGFCTPGIVMTAIPLLNEKPGASREDIKAGISGNLCRCTGYKKIVDALESAGEEMQK